MITPEEAVDAANERFGRHPASRALHAKGALFTGTFTATPEAGRLTRAAHMQGRAIDALVRFSNGSGDPQSADNKPDVRGLAVKLQLPDGSRTDIVAQTVPRFPVSTPEAFIELLRANARPWLLALFLARHPRVLPTLKVNAEALRPPSSYASVPYYGVHAFKWTSDAGERYVRYRWEPEEREPRLAKAEAHLRGPDYLQEELRERVREGRVQFSLVLQLASAGDPVDDPAAVWPDEREEVVAGTLQITALETEYEKHNVLVFDPVRVTDGIETSEDPVLLFRSPAYSVSVARRTS